MRHRRGLNPVKKYPSPATSAGEVGWVAALRPSLPPRALGPSSRGTIANSFYRNKLVGHGAHRVEDEGGLGYRWRDVLDK